MNAKKKPRAMYGSGNVFADRGLPNPEQELVKAILGLRIHRIIRQRGLTQKDAAALRGVKQPQVSHATRNRSGTFSMGRLIDFLTALGQDVQITVRTTRKEHGALSVAVPGREEKPGTTWGVVVANNNRLCRT